METIRKYYLAPFVFLLLARPAISQIGVITGPAHSMFSCSASVPSPALLRPESYTELLGDIVITCTAGPNYPRGTAIPTANIIVYVTPYPPITSRIFEPNTGLSDALLLVDEPGSSLTTGAVGNYGPQAPQVLCTLTPAACQAYSELDKSGAYPVAASEPSAGSPNAANMIQGIVGDFGANSVTFYGVPGMPPAYQGLSRVFRITNIRVPTLGITEGTQVQVFLSVNPLQVIPVAGSAMTAGLVQAAMTASVNSSPAGGNAPFPQCMPPAGPALSAQVSFVEGFKSMFKTRVAPLANTAWASTATQYRHAGSEHSGRAV